jgi:hypothetical protein
VKKPSNKQLSHLAEDGTAFATADERDDYEHSGGNYVQGHSQDQEDWDAAEAIRWSEKEAAKKRT